MEALESFDGVPGENNFLENGGRGLSANFANFREFSGGEF
jgi:hypothetical protein